MNTTSQQLIAFLGQRGHRRIASPTAVEATSRGAAPIHATAADQLIPLM
jgi:hypothetical protein